jgi:hypothetical protein
MTKVFEPTDFKSWNEQDVREEIITPLLHRLGYKKGTENDIRRGDQLKLEYDKEILGRPKKSDRQISAFPDYVLDVGSKRWVIEAKPPDCEIGKKEVWQAYSYAKHHEVRAVFFCLCNGKELQIYNTNNIPESAQVKTIKYEDFESEFDTIANILSPDAIRRTWPEIEIDTGKSLGQGLRSFARIVGGSFKYSYNSARNPALNDLLFTVTGGFIERRNDKLFCFITTRSPIASAQQLGEQIGLNKMELVSDDTLASTDQNQPNIFTSESSFTLPKGARVLNVTYPIDIKGSSKTSVRGWLDAEAVFKGTFEAVMHMGILGNMTVRGTFEVFLV